jgi:hypothetical protein
MNKCPYCGWEARTDYPVEFWCGSVTNRHRSKTCLALEIGLLKERVKRLEEAGDKLCAAFEKEWLTDGDIEAIQDDWEKAKESNP